MEDPIYDDLDPLAKFGHHPDPLIDAQVELDRLEGLIAETRAEVKRLEAENARLREELSEAGWRAERDRH